MPMQATTTAPLFSAALRPDQSLRLGGGWVAFILGAIAATPLAVLAPGVLLPALLAFGIGGAVLTILSIRQARRQRIREQVTLWTDQLEIASTDQHGMRSLRRFEPAAVRLLLDRDENEKTVRIRLRSGTDEYELGAFLNPDDRASFARAFGTALRRARRAG